MKKYALLSTAAFVFCSTAFALNAAPPKIDSSKPLNADGLAFVKNTPLDEVWVRPGTSISNYTSVIVGTVEIRQKVDRNEYELSEKSLHQITSKFREYLLIELANESGLTLTTEPSSTTLQLDVVLSDVEVNVSRRAAREIRGKTYARTLGELEVQGVLSDATTGQILSRFEDEREIDHIHMEEVNAITVGSDFRRIMRRWSSIIGEGLRTLREVNRP